MKNQTLNAVLIGITAYFAAGAMNWLGGTPGEAARLGRTEILTRNAPAPIGPYSQAILVGDTLYLAGQIAIDPETGAMVEGGIEAQTRQVMKNLQAVLDKAGFSFGDVVSAQVFLKDLDDYGAFNALYAEYFEGSAPARAVVQAARIPRDAMVEVMMTAERTEGSGVWAD